MANALAPLLRKIRACEICVRHLPLGARPILAAHPDARILVIGQAPGKRVHQSGVPWRDASGDRLRAWLGVTDEVFYDERRVALVPMGFCFPGTGRSGDNPPRPECAPEWHAKLLERLPAVRLTVLLSQYALDRYLGARQKASLTETVRAFDEYGPKIVPLPHPSPRNNLWLAKNPWFERDLLPVLRRRVRGALR